MDPTLATPWVSKTNIYTPTHMDLCIALIGDHKRKADQNVSWCRGRTGFAAVLHRWHIRLLRRQRHEPRKFPICHHLPTITTNVRVPNSNSMSAETAAVSPSASDHVSSTKSNQAGNHQTELRFDDHDNGREGYGCWCLVLGLHAIWGGGDDFWDFVSAGWTGWMEFKTLVCNVI